MPASSSSSAAASSTTIGTVVSKFLNEYVNNTPKRLKIVDCYLTYVLLTGVMQFVYCCLVGTFPFNAFLSGFISCVGSFILAVCLRLQVCTLLIELKWLSAIYLTLLLFLVRSIPRTRANFLASVRRGHSPTSSSRTFCSTSS